MHVFIDHCVIAPVVADVAGLESLADCRVTTANPAPQQRILDHLTSGRFQLVASETGQETLYRTLTKRTASDFEALDEESAFQTAAVLSAATQATGGIFVDAATVKAYVPAARAAIPASLVGNAKGQIDYEDLTVIASLLAAKDAGAPVVMLVTKDTGLLACAPHLERLDIVVVSGWRFIDNIVRIAA